MLKLLSVVFEPADALPVNETVVDELTSVGSPDITPALDNDNPAPEIFEPPVSE